MKVYHGGTCIIKSPLVNVGRAGLDFGEGFYVTDNREQAIEWAKKMADRRQTIPIINEYNIDVDYIYENFQCLKFENYDIDWLNFIADNRKGLNNWQKYDLIEGGVADDRVVDTVESYIAELISANEALKRLIYHKPNNQICILNQDIANNHLKFIDYIKL